MSPRVTFLIAFSIGVSLNSYAQWQEIAYSESAASGHNALFFTSNDTGYIAGTEMIDSDIQSYVLRTYDGGMSWDTTFIANKTFREIHFPTVDTGYIAFIENVRLGILRTVDGGDSWITIADSIAVINPPSLGLTFFNNHRGIVSFDGEGYLTNDSGNSWSITDDNPFGGAGDINSDGDWFAGTGGVNFVIFSDDQCESYSSTVLTSDATGSDLSLIQDKIALSFLGSFGGSLGYPYFNFARVIVGSLDELSFTVLDLPLLNMINDIEFASDSIIYGIALPFEQNGPKFIKSVDAGQTWYSQGVTEASENYFLLQKNLVCLNDTVCYAARGDVIYKTTNGGGPLLDPIESIVLSTENPISEIDFNVFPNPSTGHLTLEAERPLENISVFDSLGKLVFQKSLKNQIRHELNLSHFPKGLYLLQISGEEFEKTEKVVIH